MRGRTGGWTWALGIVSGLVLKGWTLFDPSVCTGVAAELRVKYSYFEVPRVSCSVYYS